MQTHVFIFDFVDRKTNKTEFERFFGRTDTSTSHTDTPPKLTFLNFHASFRLVDALDAAAD